MTLGKIKEHTVHTSKGAKIDFCDKTYYVLAEKCDNGSLPTENILMFDVLGKCIYCMLYLLVH